MHQQTLSRSGGVDLAPNAVKKIEKEKKKKNMYDGRTKEAKSFMKRMVRTKKEERIFRKSVKEKMDDFGNEYLNEANVDILRKIVKDKQNNKIKLKDGTLRIDLFSASAITQAH